MAVTKIWKVVKRMDHVIGYAKDENKTKIEFNQKYEMLVDDLQNVIDYARNSDKTEKEYFVTGINCDSDSAYEEMQDTKRYYNKKDKILAFHAYQSFAEGEVTPELAHQIGVQLANEMWGDRFQVVVTTHLNTNHIHNHIVLNSVSFEDGLKYYDNHTNYAKMRHISDELCKEYGLSVIEEKETKKKMNYDNFYKKSLYTDNYSNNAKRDLDLAIRQAYSYDDFLYLMKKLDYEIIFRANKISIRKEPYKRNIRVERRFGEEYSMDNIRHIIFEINPWKTEERVNIVATIPARKFTYHGHAKNLYKPKGLVALFRYYCFLLKVYPKKQQKYKMSPEMRREIRKLDQYSAEANMMCKYKMRTLDDVRNCKGSKQDELKNLYNERNRLYYKRKSLDGGIEKDAVTEEIIKVTDKIKNVKRELFYCDDISTRTNRMIEDIKFIEEEKWNKQNEKEKKKEKSKIK